MPPYQPRAHLHARLPLSCSKQHTHAAYRIPHKGPTLPMQTLRQNLERTHASLEKSVNDVALQVRYTRSGSCVIVGLLCRSAIRVCYVS